MYIEKDRDLDFAKTLDIDLDDVDSYPKSVVDLLIEKKKYDAYIETKEEKIKEVEDRFHKFAQE